MDLASVAYLMILSASRLYSVEHRMGNEYGEFDRMKVDRA
jgi:hypothetical protein